MMIADDEMAVIEEMAEDYAKKFGHGSSTDYNWCKRDFKAGYQAAMERVKKYEPDGIHNHREFNEWWLRLCHVDYACFFRDILRALKGDMWEQYKKIADEYAKTQPSDKTNVTDK